MPAHHYLATPTRDLAVGDRLSLDAAQSQYLGKVMRYRQGQTIAAFDGQGLRFQAEIMQLRPVVDVRVTATEAREPPPPQATHLGLSVLKGPAMDRAIQLATEMGVASLLLVFAQRSNVTLSGERLEKKLQHWRKVIIAACEQCGRSYIPPLDLAASWHAAQTTLAQHSVRDWLVCEQEAPSLTQELPQSQGFVVGPEGGWSDSEAELFATAGLPKVGFGHTIIRAETMPAVILAVTQHLATNSPSRAAD